MAVGIGIIGAGVMGAHHARILAGDVAGARLVAISDTDEGRARAAADETGAGRSYADGLALIDDVEVEAVLIASPDDTHAGFVRACLEAGKPVLCEKPLAPTPDECRRLVEAETSLGRRLIQVGYMRRFDPAYGDLRDMLRQGHLGRPLLLHCAHRNASAPAFFTPEMWITNAAVHEIDIIRWLVGQEIVAATALTAGQGGDRARHDPLMLIVETSGGVLADVEIFMNARYGYDIRAELVCEGGTLDLARPRPVEVRHSGCQSLSFPADWRGRFHDAYRRQLQAWVDSLRRGGAVGASAWDGYMATLIADEALRSLATGGRIEMRLPPKPDLYATA